MAADACGSGSNQNAHTLRTIAPQAVSTGLTCGTITKMKKTHRVRGPKGRFVKATDKRKGLTARDWVSVLIAGLAAIGMALTLGRCHMIWSEDNVYPILMMPQDLNLPFH